MAKEKSWELLDPEELKNPYQFDYGMRLLTCHFTIEDIRNMNDLVKRKRFPNRSELIRFAVKGLLLEYGYK